MKIPKEIFELEAEVILWCNIEVILVVFLSALSSRNVSEVAVSTLNV